MIIWILVGLILLLAAVSGFFAGAVRTLVSIAGFFVSLAAAYPLGNLCKPLFVKGGVVNPVWLYVLPPITLFVVVGLVFFGVSFLVHIWADRHFKFRADDVSYLQWIRLNQRCGAGLGLGLGALHAVLILWLIYAGGYPTTQLVADESTAGAIGFLNQARKSLQESGLDRVAAAVDKTPENYYQTCDILGLIHHNPLVLGRLANYPSYIPLASAQEFQDAASDTEFQQLLQTSSSIGTLLEHPKTQAILNNSDLLAKVIEVDLKDLRAYLETGKSPKFQAEKILGRWTFDAYSSLLLGKKLNPSMSASRMKMLRKVMTTIAPYFTIAASPDKSLVLSLKGAEDAINGMIQSMAPPAPAAPAAEAAAQQPAMDPSLAQRYGLTRRGGSGRGGPGPAPGAQAPPPGEDGSTPAVAPSQTPVGKLIASLAFSANGTWEYTGSQYEGTLQADKGGSSKVTIQVKDEELILKISKDSQLVFLRTE